MSASFGQDVAAGEGSAHGVDDGGDVDGGERGIHERVHPGPDRCPGRPAPLQQPVNQALAVPIAVYAGVHRISTATA